MTGALLGMELANSPLTCTWAALAAGVLSTYLTSQVPLSEPCPKGGRQHPGSAALWSHEG